MKYKVLKNNVFGEGYKEGDIIEREHHAMTSHIQREEVVEYVEPVKEEKKPSKESTSEKKENKDVKKVKSVK